MSAKNLDQHGRWRNKIVAFRVSPEEDVLIESAVRISGLTKQDYITRRLTEMDVVVQGNPKVYRGLKIEMQKIFSELERLSVGDAPQPEIVTLLSLIASVMNGMKEEMDGR